MKTTDPYKRFWLKVRKTDTCWYWLGFTDPRGYGRFFLNGKREWAHRASYQLFVSPIPEGTEIDHICRNGSCVRPSHLRAVTHAQNQQNRDKYSNNKSGFKGVHWSKQKMRWQARVTLHGRQIHAGFFDRAEDAGAAALELRMRLLTHNDVDRGGDSNGPASFGPEPSSP